jgi:hypothetical protein
MWVFSLNGEYGGGECHGGSNMRFSNGGLSFHGDEDFGWCFLTYISDIGVGGST